jgi:hypothetical protein
MDQPAAKKPVPLIVIRYRRRVKNKIVHRLLVIKSTYGNNHGDDDDNNCNRKFHSINVVVSCELSMMERKKIF